MATQTEMRTKSQTKVFGTLAQIIRTADLTPRMRRITLGGEGLAPLLEGTRLPADAIKLYLPVPGEAGFMPEFGVLPSDDNPFSIRAYTIRRFDPIELELDIDIVLHGDSPGSVWARNAKAGDQIGFVGPRHDFLAPDNTDWYLLAGDETALPAMSAIVESLPAHVRVFMFVEVTDESDVITVRSDADMKVTWLLRGSTHPAQSNLLEQVVRNFEWQESRGYIWVVGETSVVRGIRRYLRNECQIAKDQLHITGYWRSGMNNSEFDQQTLKEYQVALANGKAIDDHHDVDQLDEN